MQKVVLEDFRREYPGQFSVDRPYRVKALTNTVEFYIGQRLTLKEVEALLQRHGTNTVKVDIVKGDKK